MYNVPRCCPARPSCLAGMSFAASIVTGSRQPVCSGVAIIHAIAINSKSIIAASSQAARFFIGFIFRVLLSPAGGGGVRSSAAMMSCTLVPAGKGGTVVSVWGVQYTTRQLRPRQRNRDAAEWNMRSRHQLADYQITQLPNASVASCWAGDFRGPSTISWPQAARMSLPRLLRTDTMR